MRHICKNITPLHLITETIGVSNLLSRKQIGIEFSEEGDACTDGQKIVLPKIDINKHLTKRAATVFRGLVDHESAHVRFTDFDTLETIKNKPEYTKLLLNVIEDIRIDKKISEEFSGSTININELCNDSIDEIFNDFIKLNQENNLTAGISNDLDVEEEFKYDDKSIGVLYLHLLGMKSRGISNEKLDTLIDAVPMHIKSKLSKLEPQLKHLDNTYDALSMAENAAHLIGFKPDKLSKEEEELTEKIVNFFNKILVEEIGRRMLEKFDKEKIDLETESKPHREEICSYVVPTTLYDEYRPAKRNTLGVNKELVFKEKGSLLYSFQNLLKTEVYVAKEISEHGKKLDPKSLVRAFQGYEKVFQKKSLDKDLDTAILFAVDASGSMCGHPTDVAFSAAYAMCRCLDSMNVQTKVTSFTTGECIPGVKVTNHLKWDGYRYERLRNLIHKDWHESTFDKRYHFDPENQWNNADGESLMIFGRDLLNQPQSKKIMIVLSDGYPQATKFGSDEDMLKQTVDYLENQGLILGSIGINSDAPKEFYKNNTVINNLDQLPRALSDLCGKLIKEND